jgi:DNA (cytosine-5)-methyltransferase 1
MEKIIKVGSDFSGVGAFNQALLRLRIKHEEIFACDMDKYARETFIHNYGEPKYFPSNVYEREVPEESLDIYMTSPPCQAFSLAGKRKGKQDKRGILFFNSLEFIEGNKPRFFIFENVKGLLSDDSGKTFSEWINYLGGKSVNGNPVIFPYEDSVPYHIYWQVLNAKNYGVPQNRERVFIIGIRDDSDNFFSFPPEEHLIERLKDVLENEIDEKYFLSDKQVSTFVNHTEKQKLKGNGFEFKPTDGNKVGKAITTKAGSRSDDNFIKITNSNLNTTQTDGIIIHNIPEKVKVRKHTVDVKALQECLKKHKNTTIKNISKLVGVPLTEAEHWFRTDTYFAIPNPDLWDKIKEVLSIQTTEFDASIKEFVEQDGVFEKSNRVYDENGIAPTMTSTSPDERILKNKRIRRLTPRECFRLMDFPDSFTWICSDSQAYKQAGNSIVVGVLAKLIQRLKL